MKGVAINSTSGGFFKFTGLSRELCKNDYAYDINRAMTMRQLRVVYRSCNSRSMFSHAFLGTRTEDGDDVVILNPSKIPSKREFTGRKEYNNVMDCLLL